MPRFMCFGLILLLHPLAAWADEPPRFAALAPGNTYLAVAAPNLAETARQFTALPLGARLSGAEFKPLRAALALQQRAAPLYLKPAFGFDWSDLSQVAAPGGLAIFPLPDGQPGAAVLLLAPPTEPTVAACLAAAEAEFTRLGFTPRDEKRDATALKIFTPPATLPHEGPRVLVRGAAFAGVANSRAAADALLAVKPDQSLAAAQVFPQDDKQVAFFARPFELWELLLYDQPADAKERKSLKTAQRLGFAALKSLTGQIDFAAAAPLQSRLEIQLEAPRPYLKALQVAALKPGPMPTLPAWLDGEFSSILFLTWDFPTVMKGFGALFDEANDPGPAGEGLFEDVLDSLHDDPEGPRVDLRRELFDKFGDEMIQIHYGEGEQRQSFYVAPLRDEAAVVKTMERFYRDDERVTHESPAGFELWTVGPNASLFVEGEDETTLAVRGLAIGGGRIYFATEVERLKQLVAGGKASPPLQDAPIWKPLLSWIEAQSTKDAAARGLMRLDRELGASYRAAAAPKDAANERDVLARLWGVLLYGTTAPASTALIAATPKFEVLQEAFEPAALVVTQTPGGWKLTLGMARPEKKHQASSSK